MEKLDLISNTMMNISDIIDRREELMTHREFNSLTWIEQADAINDYMTKHYMDKSHLKREMRALVNARKALDISKEFGWDMSDCNIVDDACACLPELAYIKYVLGIELKSLSDHTLPNYAIRCIRYKDEVSFDVVHQLNTLSDSSVVWEAILWEKIGLDTEWCFKFNTKLDIIRQLKWLFLSGIQADINTIKDKNDLKSLIEMYVKPCWNRKLNGLPYNGQENLYRKYKNNHQHIIDEFKDIMNVDISEYLSLELPLKDLTRIATHLTYMTSSDVECSNDILNIKDVHTLTPNAKYDKMKSLTSNKEIDAYILGLRLGLDVSNMTEEELIKTFNKKHNIK